LIEHQDGGRRIVALVHFAAAYKTMKAYKTYVQTEWKRALCQVLKTFRFLKENKKKIVLESKLKQQEGIPAKETNQKSNKPRNDMRKQDEQDEQGANTPKQSQPRSGED